MRNYDLFSERWSIIAESRMAKLRERDQLGKFGVLSLLAVNTFKVWMSPESTTQL